MFQLSVNKLYAVGKLIFLALKWWIFFPLTLNIFWGKKNIFWRWLIYRGFLVVGKVGKRVRPVARFLTSEKDLFRCTNVWGPVSQRASAGMTSGWPLNNFLLTEREGRTGKYWPEVVAVRTERSEVRTKTTQGQYSPVRLELAWLVSSLLYGFLITFCFVFASP